MKNRRIISSILIVCICANMVACSFEAAKETASSAAGTVKNAAVSAKDAVVEWYSNIDFTKFKEGWDYAVDYMGAQYAAAMSSEYVASVQAAISDMEMQINSTASKTRGIAQEAGFLAEKWVSDTFNINAVANGSEYRADLVGSNDFASVDVSTNYGENASLKYYKTADGSASAQSTTLMERYWKYEKGKENPLSLNEYMTMQGYDPETQDAILASIYDGQTRIIPADQLEEAKAYLQGRIDKLSAIDGDVASARTKSYQETLDHLSDRLKAPDGTESIPLTYEDAQAIAELSQTGDFKPEDFGISVTSVISPKYVVKQAMGTGIEVGAINLALEIGPDVYSIIKEAATTGHIDEEEIKDVGIEGVVATSGGFVEGSVCSAVTTLCKAGKFGPKLVDVDPSVVATLTVLVMESAIHGCELAMGKITAEDYGNIMVDRFMVSMLAIPTSALMIALLPDIKILSMAGCMAGGMVACVGYMVAKTAIMDIIDGGGFEAIIPANVSNAMSVAKGTIASMNIGEKVSTLKDSVVATVSDGYIEVKTLITS